MTKPHVAFPPKAKQAHGGRRFNKCQRPGPAQLLATQQQDVAEPASRKTTGGLAALPDAAG